MNVTVYEKEGIMMNGKRINAAAVAICILSTAITLGLKAQFNHAEAINSAYNAVLADKNDASSFMQEESCTLKTESNVQYAELELHNNEKQICTMEQVDAIIENGFAHFKQSGRKTINKDHYIEIIHHGNRSENDLEIKSFLYHMMLNSIDYFNSAEGSMTYAIPKESPVEIDFQTDIALQECYESDRECDEEIEKLYVSDGITHRIDHKNKNYKNTRLAIPAEFVVNDNSRTMLLDNGEAMTLNRNDLTNLGIAGSSCLFPQLYAVKFLSNFDSWYFSKTQDYLKRECIKIKGNYNENHFEMIIDVNTGILLGYEVYNNAGELKGYVKTSELEIDTPVKVRHFDETLYTNYSCD